MPCRTRREEYKETCGFSEKCKTKHACIVESDESTRKCTEGTLHKGHEDHVAGRGINSLNHCNLVHQFILMPQAIKIPDAKTAVDKEWEKLANIPAWQLSKVRCKKEVIAVARNEGNCTFCVVDGHLSSQEFGVGTKKTEIQRSNCTPS